MTLNLNQMIAVVFITVLFSVIAFYERQQKKREERYLRDIEKHTLEVTHLKQQCELLKVKKSKIEELEKAIKSNKINLTRNYNKLKKRDAKIKALEQSS